MTYSNVAHSRFYIFDMKLIFQTDGQAVKRSDGFAILCIIIIQCLSISYRSIEKDLMKTIDLLQLSIVLITRPRVHTI